MEKKNRLKLIDTFVEFQKELRNYVLGYTNDIEKVMDKRKLVVKQLDQ